MNALDITLAIIVTLWLLYFLCPHVWRWIKYDNARYRHDLERQWYNDQARIAAAAVKRERKNAKRLADAQRCCERCDEP